MPSRFRLVRQLRSLIHNNLLRIGLLAACGVLTALPTLPLRTAGAQVVSTSRDPANTASIDIQKLRDLQRKTQETIQRVTPCIVAVSGGSGVVVSEDGLVLTVAHVGQKAGRTVMMTFPDGRRVRGKTLGNDKGIDAGMIKITQEGKWPHVEMGTSDDLQVGQWCLAMGYPVTFDRGKPPVVRIGRIQRNNSTTIVTDCTIMGGDSGGPLFDLDGKLIGVGSRCDNRLTINIHVPIECYNDHWDRLAKGEDFDSQNEDVAFLGIVPEDDAEEAKIGHVYEDSGAAKAGINVEDVIIRFDDTKIEGFDDLIPLIRKKKPGDAVKIEVRRGEERVEFEVTLGKRDG
jgi:serine protease Do